MNNFFLLLEILMLDCDILFDLDVYMYVIFVSFIHGSARTLGVNTNIFFANDDIDLLKCEFSSYRTCNKF